MKRDPSMNKGLLLPNEAKGQGFVDILHIEDGQLFIEGWAAFQDGDTYVPPHNFLISINGTPAGVLAPNLPRKDVRLYLAATTDAFGFAARVSLKGLSFNEAEDVPTQVDVFALDEHNHAVRLTFSQECLSPKAADASAVAHYYSPLVTNQTQVHGHVDVVRAEHGQLTIEGWGAFEEEGKNVSAAAFLIIINGQPVGWLAPNFDREDIQRAQGVDSGTLGFAASIEVQDLNLPEAYSFSKGVVVYALSANGRTAQIPAAAKDESAMIETVKTSSSMACASEDSSDFKSYPSGGFATHSSSRIYHRCKDMDAKSWRDMLLLSVDTQRIGDMLFPSLPSEEIQRSMVATSGKQTIEEMYMFYKALHAGVAKLSWYFGPKTRILDFGCGFGRLTRYFLKDTDYGNLYGADTVQKFINICRTTFSDGIVPPENFLHNAPMPPLDIPSHSLDLITAYSVFTHLSEQAANCWIDEFHRILKPGGLLVLTLRQKNYLEFCHQLAQQENLSYYEEIQVKAFANIESRKQYERGEYIFYPSGGGETLFNTFYGDTIVPEKYVETNWTEKFIIREMYDDPSRLVQAFLLMQAK